MADAGEKKGFFGTPNLALWDRIVRVALAVAIALAWYAGYIPAGIAMAALILAGALAVNGILGHCALYALLGVSTCKIPKRKTGI